MNFSNRINSLVSPDMKRSQLAEMKRSQMAEQGQNVQVIPINNQAITRNALTERSASSRHLGYMHGGNPPQQSIQMHQSQQQPHQNLKQSRYLQNHVQPQQQPQPQFQPQQYAQPQPQPQQYQQQPHQNMRGSSDFHGSSPFHNVGNRQFFASPPEPQPQQQQPQMVQPQQQMMQSQPQNFGMSQQTFNNMGQQQQQQQFNSMTNFNQSTNNFRPRSPGPGPAGFNSQMGGVRDSVTKRKLAYGNQDRPKSSRGGGFLGGLFG